MYFEVNSLLTNVCTYTVAGIGKFLHLKTTYYATAIYCIVMILCIVICIIFRLHTKILASRSTALLVDRERA